MNASASGPTNRSPRTFATPRRRVWVITPQGWTLVPTDLPTVTVIVVVRNHVHTLGRCLDAIFHQDYPPDLVEVLVVDNGSTDGSREVVTLYRHLHPNLRLLANPTASILTGLNRALQEAKGDILVRLEGNMLIPPDHLRRCVVALQRRQLTAVGVPVELCGPSGHVDAMTMVLGHPLGGGLTTVCGSWPRLRKPSRPYLMAWHRHTLHEIGGFGPDLPVPDDLPVYCRSRRYGSGVGWLADAGVRQVVSTGWRQLAQERVRAGYWAARWFRQERSFPPLRLLVLPGLVFLFWTLWFLGWHFPWAARAAGALLWGYLGLTGLMAIVTGGVRRPRLWGSIWLATVIVHWAWGMGFGAGILAPRSHAVKPQSRRKGS